MAKWGEGDPRWIVEERPDAINVNNWHWTEKNATPWSKERLKELLVGQRFEKGSVVIVFGDFKKLEGEATANNRKAKLIFLFEWVIELRFEAKVAGSDAEYKGYVEIPNLSDENEANEVDVILNMDSKGPHEAEIRHIFHDDVPSFIRKQLATYLRELKEEFSKGLILPTDRAIPQVISKGKSNVGAVNIDKKDFQNHFVTSVEKKDVSAPLAQDLEVKSLTISESFKAPPDRLWEVLTNPQFVKQWSNSSVQMDFKVNGAFSLFNGMVTGQFIAIEAGKELKTRWRLKSYPSGHFAIIRFILKDEKDSTTMDILGSEVPRSQAEETEEGLRRFYLQNISRTFGFGAHIF